jgi:hypothetical protein
MYDSQWEACWRMRSIAVIFVAGFVGIVVGCKSAPKYPIDATRVSSKDRGLPADTRGAGSGKPGAGAVGLGGPGGSPSWSERGGQGITRLRWRLSGETDLPGRVTYGCFVPSGPKPRSGHYLDMFVSRDGKCLVWYVHVWASQEHVRVVRYQVDQLSADGQTVMNTEDVVDPPGFGNPTPASDAEWTLDESFGVDPRPAGLQRRALSLERFPLLLEWQIVKVPKGAIGRPQTWIAEPNPAIALQGSAIIDRDRPPPTPGSLSEPSFKLQLCKADLETLRVSLDAGTAEKFDLLLRVGAAPGAIAPSGFKPDEATQFETRVPITRQRIESCLGAGD